MNIINIQQYVEHVRKNNSWIMGKSFYKSCLVLHHWLQLLLCFLVFHKKYTNTTSCQWTYQNDFRRTDNNEIQITNSK